MLRLNLLSQEAREDIKFKRFYSLTKRVSFILIAFFLIWAVIFFGAKTLLKINYKDFTNQENLIKINNQEYNQKTLAINQDIRLIEEIQNSYISPSLLIKELIKNIPPGISLSSANFDLKKQTLKIIGVANKRENFLSLKTQLSLSSVFMQVESPLQNILQKENIDFDINIKLDLGKLNTENK